MKPLPLSAFTPSLNSSQRIETFDESVRRFNTGTDISTSDGRLFSIEYLAVKPHFLAWEQIFIADMELFEKGEQYPLAFQVTIYWEAMFGHSFPSNETLCRMTRACVGAYLQQNRFSPGYSSHWHLRRLQIPESKPEPYL